MRIPKTVFNEFFVSAGKAHTVASLRHLQLVVEARDTWRKNCIATALKTPDHGLRV